VSTTSNKRQLASGISIIAIAAALGIATPAHAQTTSTVRGHVEGAAAGSTVTLTDVNTGHTDTAKVDANGNYIMVGLAPSTYRVQSAGRAETVVVPLGQAVTVDLAAPAEDALAAIDRGIEGDAIACLEACYAGADCSDHARGLVAHDDGRDAAAGTTVVAVHIAAADAAGRYANKNFTRAGLRLGEIGEFELQILFEQEGFHQGSGNGLQCFAKARLYNRRRGAAGQERPHPNRKYVAGWGHALPGTWVVRGYFTHAAA